MKGPTRVRTFLQEKRERLLLQLSQVDQVADSLGDFLIQSIVAQRPEKKKISIIDIKGRVELLPTALPS